MIKELFCLVLCALLSALCLPAEAQQGGKIFRIGYLDNSTAAGSAILIDVFRRELSKLGRIEGKNIAIDYRFSDGKPERLPELVSELLRLKVDLIVTRGGTTESSGQERHYHYSHRDGCVR